MLCALDCHELSIQLRIARIRVSLALFLHKRPFLHPISTHRYSPQSEGIACRDTCTIACTWSRVRLGGSTYGDGACAPAAMPGCCCCCCCCCGCCGPLGWSCCCAACIVSAERRCVRQQRRGQAPCRGRSGEGWTRSCGCAAGRRGWCVPCRGGVDIISMDLPPMCAPRDDDFV
jgi:hypothetical protein